MNYIKHLRGFFNYLDKDEKMTAHHISLYMALFNVWNINRFREYFEINRMDLMAMARIGSKNTYSKCMKELNDWGYIQYASGSNRYQVSKVSCTRFDTVKGTANGTTIGAATGTASSTPFINYSNGIKDKQTTNNFKNGKGEKRNGKNHLHVSIDKDYSEPL